MATEVPRWIMHLDMDAFFAAVEQRDNPDLRRLSLTQLQAHLGPRAATSLYQKARGIASDRVGEHGSRQSLSKETTFGQDAPIPDC